MKKALKIVVSVVLVVVILASIAWYLFEYDPGFTRDFLLSQAHRFEQQGHNSVAVWMYNLAYHQADQDDTVAIELAEYYKSIGNYTKAEYTLSKAIEDGGGVELYVALCQLFVEQDKLLDAVTMLDRVSAPEIKQQLDALRPAAPVASYPSGHYSQYITVDFSAENATIYTATDLDYPSIPEDLYTGPVSLSRGETVFYAVAVSENGLVSPVAEYQYTVSGVVELITFTDSAFEDAVREQLQLSGSDMIYSTDLWEVTQFQIPASAITCADLLWMPNLIKLTMSGCAFNDLYLLENMTKLEELTISDCVLSANDLAVIAQLPSLKSLTLSGCYLSSINNLSQAENLTYLDLSRNSIRDLSALSHMTGLETLNLSQNALVNLDALRSLSGLKSLDVSYNSLVTTAPVADLVGLTKLNVSANALMKLEGIDALTELTWFAASDNNLIDVNILANCTKLQTLIVSNNTILTLDVLLAHKQLEYLDFSDNEVTSLPKFTDEYALMIVNGSHNLLTSLDRLAVLQKLEYIYMDYNTGLKVIDKLANCPMLVQVNVYGTKVRSAAQLIDKGIIVNYTPV